MTFRNRIEAGRRLADPLQDYSGKPDILLLALPRGGVPVAAEVAKTLDLPMDLMLVRKLGLPGHRELAMGAIALGDVRVLNDSVIVSSGVSEETLDQVTSEEKAELDRRNTLYRGENRPPAIKDKTIILIDDGVATGATMKAAIAATKQAGAKETVAAIPVAPAETCDELQRIADRVVCLATPYPFFGVGQWYDDFSQTSDGEVQDLMKPFLN
ncbi:phosphoribosyltransferase [Aestuariispira ectoiniformans]|uniref:phosphoribosyltransferase n=1 Tax=Aestuariispira ectoiniformans TaxID=2775080 RepID=UPI00223C32B4|nr:phosphoribosyltransferase [Aestuariispira ectoiniformans]